MSDASGHLLKALGQLLTFFFRLLVAVHKARAQEKLPYLENEHRNETQARVHIHGKIYSKRS